MKQALVIYETLFGNARAAAQSVADGLSEGCDVRLMDVSQAPSVIPDEVDLVVVGGPTHQLGMTRPSSRRSAAAQYPEAPKDPGPGLREWLSAVQAPKGTSAAAFDTRLNHPAVLRKLDHASRSEQRMLRRRGMRMIAPAEDFLVETATGPVAAGELDRAREWGRKLATLMATSEVK